MNEEQRNSSERAGMVPRQPGVTALQSGYPSATGPVSVRTLVHTDTAGVTAGEIAIPVHDGEIPGYQAAPVKGAKFPVVIVVQEIFGVHDHIKDICRRLAKLGYLAVAPELYARQGDVSKIPDIQQIMVSVVSKVSDAQVISDLDAAVAWAQASGKGDISRLGITGFCWGGRIVWLYAAHSPRLKAGVAWYGRLVNAPNERQPIHPLDVVTALKAPVLGLYGGADPSIPGDTIERMRAGLRAVGSSSEIVVYPDAGHAFFADYRPSYRKDDAEDGWKRMLEWFRQHGVN